jgi:4-carboxymuconolactone decarboxylase
MSAIGPKRTSVPSGVRKSCYDLLSGGAVSDETFKRAKQLLGEQQIVDLTAVAGTYITVAMILTMSEESVPPGKDLPFKTGEP